MSGTFNDYLQSLKNSPEYWEQAPRDDFSDALFMIMNEKNMLQKNVAARAELSPAVICHALNGDSILLKTMCRIAYALGYRVRIRLERIADE